MPTNAKVSDNIQHQAPLRGLSKRSQSLAHFRTGRRLPEPMRNRPALVSSVSLKLHSPVPRDEPSSPSTKKNAIWGRVRNAMRPRPRSGAVVAEDLNSIEHSLDSMEAFLKAVSDSPEAKTLVRKELDKTLRTLPRRSSHTE